MVGSMISSTSFGRRDIGRLIMVPIVVVVLLWL